MKVLVLFLLGKHCSVCSQWVHNHKHLIKENDNHNTRVFFVLVVRLRMEKMKMMAFVLVSKWKGGAVLFSNQRNWLTKEVMFLSLVW